MSTKFYVSELPETCGKCWLQKPMATFTEHVDCRLIGDTHQPVSSRYYRCPLAVLPDYLQPTIAQSDNSVCCAEVTEPTKPTVNYGSFTDPRDGKTYRTVKIGKQEWFAENLNYECAGSYCYDNDPASGDKYGRLYNWYAAMTAAPTGWRLPTNKDWDDLIEAVGGNDIAGKKLKTTHRWYCNGYGTDEYCFAALPGGCTCDDSLGDFGEHGYWWSATEYNAKRAHNVGCSSRGDYMQCDNWRKTDCMSVRCVREAE